MDVEHLFFGGALLGVLASCWAYIKMSLWRVVNLLVVKIRVKEPAGRALAYYFWSNFARSPFGEKEYGGLIAFVQPTGRNQLVGFEEAGRDFAVFWQGWRPLVVFMDYPTGNNGGHVPNMAISVLFLRWMFEADDLLTKAIDAWNERQHAGDDKGRGRFTINRLFGFLLSGRAVARGRGTSNGPQGLEVAPETAAEEIPPNQRYLKWPLDQLGTSPGDVDPFSILAFPASRKRTGCS